MSLEAQLPPPTLRIDGIRPKSRPTPLPLQKEIVKSVTKLPRAQKATYKRVRSIVTGGTTFILIVTSLYVLIAPVLPAIHIQFTHTPVPAVQAASLPLSQVVTLAADAPAIPGANWLGMSSIGVDGAIHEGQNEDTLLQGIWHRPASSTPDKGSNTVLAAHRFLYLSGGNTFYHLDQVKLGDGLDVRWNGRLYSYVVYRAETVSSRSVEIEAPTPDAIITLYTCTPLWTSENRLVVQARLEAIH